MSYHHPKKKKKPIGTTPHQKNTQWHKETNWFWVRVQIYRLRGLVATSFRLRVSIYIYIYNGRISMSRIIHIAKYCLNYF